MSKSPCDTCTLKQGNSCPYVKNFEDITIRIQQSKANCKKHADWLKAEKESEINTETESWDARLDDDRQEYSEPDYYEE